jgi:type I restriction enzyme S subunit
MKNNTIKLGKVVRIQSGYSPSSFTLTDNGPIPYIKVEDMNNCNKYQNESRFYTDDIKRSVPAGAVIFPKRGAAIMNNKVRIAERDICMDTNMMALIPDQQYLDSEYLFNLLIHEKLYKIADTSTIPQINNKHIDPYIIPLPSISEQKEIVKFITQWDTAIEKTEALIDAKERQFGWLRSNIIKNAKNTKAQKFGDFLKESRIPDTINDPQKRLTVRLHLNGVDVREYRGTEKEGATQYFTRKSGQLIYGKQNIFRGSIGIIPPELDGYSSSQDIPAFEIAESIDAIWLYWNMSRPRFYERLEHFAAGSGSKRLHPKELFKMNIDVPPIEEQKRIAHTLNTAQQEIKLLKKLADQYRTQKRGLMQKLLSGEWYIKNKEAA